MIKRYFLVILIVLAACAPAATETLVPVDPPSNEVSLQIPPTELPPTAIPPTAIPTPEPPTPVPTPEAIPFAINPNAVFTGLTVQFNAPDNMTCDLYVLNDYPIILSTDSNTCLLSSPMNNILWGKLTDEKDKIVPLKKYEDVLDFLEEFLQADVYASNELGFGIDPQDYVGQQNALFDLNLNENTFTVILWLNALDAQAEINVTSEGNDNTKGEIETPPPTEPPPTGGP